jgi:predicted transcriptional regulator
MERRTRLEIIADLLECAEEGWLNITGLANHVGVSYSKAAVESRKLVKRGLMVKTREGRTLLYRTNRDGKRVAEQIRQVLAYLK